MSFNQSRSDKSSGGGGGDSQYRKSGYRSGNAATTAHASSYQRTNSGYGKPTVGGGGPPRSYQRDNNNSFKNSNNAKGEQLRGSVLPVNPELNNVRGSSRNVQTGVSQQVPCRGAGDVPVSATSMGTDAVQFVSNINPPGLKSSQSTSVSTNQKPIQTPPKTEGGPPKGFALQFGSISPGFVNGIQLPPRTTSAPPNLDEQNQAQRDFSKTAATVPLPSIPKHQLPVKEPNVVKHPVAVSKILEKESLVSSPTPSSHQKPFVTPLSSMSSQVPVQFGVSPQYPLQMVPSASHSHQMFVSSVQQPMFVPSVQPHPMQHHGIMHQGHGLGFPNHFGPQMSHQMSNISINSGPQFIPPPAVKYDSRPRTVKITHPDTREELRLDRRGKTIPVLSPKSGIQNTVPPQPQPVLPVITPHSSNYFPSSFGSPVYHPPAMSVPFSTQVTPDLQKSRGHYPISQGPQSTISSNPSSVIKVVNPTHGLEKRLDQENPRKVIIELPSANKSTKQNVSSKVDSISVSVGNDINPTASLDAEVSHGTLATTAVKNSTGVVTPILVKIPASTHSQSTPAFEVSASNDGSQKSSIIGLSSIKNEHKKPNNIEHHQSQFQGVGQVSAPPTSTQLSDDRPARITEGTASLVLSGPAKVVSVQTSEDLVSPDASGSPKLTVSIATSCEGSREQVESLQSKSLEQVSDKLNTVTKEDVASKEKISLTTAVEECEAQIGVIESVNVQSPRRFVVYSGESAVRTENHETTTDDSKLPTVVLESKGSETHREAVSNHVDAINSTISASHDRATLELNRPKSATTKGKKKIREMLQKADAAGTTSDLYTAYKTPEEKDSASSTVAAGSEFSSDDVKQLPFNAKEDTSGNNQAHSKSEPDNWEDADDDTSPKLKISGKLKSESSGSNHDANEMKKYTKDFLMKFKDQCDTLPDDFYIPQEFSRALLASNSRSVKVERSASDRSLGTARFEHREMEDKKWGVGSNSFSSKDPRNDFGHGNNMGRPGSGGSSGGRHPRGQAGRHYGGILSGPLQPMNSFHSDSEGERWQRHPSSQRGLISSPHTPAQMMHKAEKKYEVGIVTDEEQAKQRQLKGILNKLTPQNFERLFEQVKAVNIDNALTLNGVISQIFDKALMEPTFCEMYADFCCHLVNDMPDFTEGNEKITFKRVLLNKCQEEFERGEREEAEANKVEEEGEVPQSNEEREEKRVKARRRMLGNIRLIGELYKKRMLTERIMHECIKKLLGPHQNADEEDIEALCKLMSTIGVMIDHPKAKTHMDAYFDMMLGLSNNMKYSSRVRFMLKDSIDLRKNKWQQRQKVEGPKKIEDVHRDAAHERQAQSSRLTRGLSMNASSRRGTATDFGPRGSSILPSPNSQHGDYRSFPSQARGFGGTQDVRMEDRQQLYETRNLSVPLPQRGAGSDAVTLGPQGGLARGMSMRGAPPAHITPSPGLNGYWASNERSAYNSNDNAFSRSASGRLAVSANNQPSGLERNLSLENEIRISSRTTDRAMTPDTAQPAQILSEECLRTMCTSTIKEFYSARDEKEVASCIKDMNTPSFHPSMVALWVSDSFERKDMERNLLSKLLVSLAKSQDNSLTHNDLLKGFESVLSTLEDAATDAPKAPEFLGRLFATVIVENVIPLQDIREIIHKGGEEPGRLVESGLAGDVIGNILEVFQSDKGESYLNQIHSSLRLEEFKPPHPLKSKKLEKFL